MKQYKYKIGDTVRILNPDNESNQVMLPKHLGKIGTIEKLLPFDVNYPYDYIVNFGEHSYCFDEDELEKVNVPEYIPIGTSIDRWMKNPEFNNINNN